MEVKLILEAASIIIASLVMLSTTFSELVVFLSRIPDSLFGGFFGGFFAAFFTNYFQNKSRIAHKRRDRYFKHRNTVVQMEYELIPLRLNLSRDISSIDTAIEGSSESKLRTIDRFYPLKLSSGLNLQLLNIEIINDYSKLHSDIESFNSDLKYLHGIVHRFQDELQKTNRSERMLISLTITYAAFLEHLKNKGHELDESTRSLLAKVKLILNEGVNDTLNNYIRSGDEVVYDLNSHLVKKFEEQVEFDESDDAHPGEPKPTFVTPYMDIHIPPKI